MPFGLTSTTWPFAVIRPAMSDGSPPRTRLTASEDEEGCAKLVCSPAPTEKLRQSMTARLLDWLTSSREGLVCTIWALPPTTTPPCGLAKAAAVNPAAKTNSAAAAALASRGQRVDAPITQFPHTNGAAEIRSGRSDQSIPFKKSSTQIGMPRASRPIEALIQPMRHNDPSWLDGLPETVLKSAGKTLATVSPADFAGRDRSGTGGWHGAQRCIAARLYPDPGDRHRRRAETLCRPGRAARGQPRDRRPPLFARLGRVRPPQHRAAPGRHARHGLCRLQGG